MPFISKDWRSPGEEWVKTQEGWEKKKVLECAQPERCAAISNFNNAPDDPLQHAWEPAELTESGKLTGDNVPGRIPPHCHITIKCTREIAGFNGLTEAVRRLDFMSAVRDVRRFNYICALLNLLVSGQKLTALPGGAQKVLLTMLEEVAVQVSNSQQNLKALRNLIVALGTMCEDERRSCWGRPLGSKALWGHHSDTISRIHDIAQRIDIQEPGPEIVPKLQQLPEECIREVLLRISDHKDLEASSAAWSVMASLCSERRIWRELVHFHFSPSQIEFARNKVNALPGDKCDWKSLFHTLRKSFGLREDVQYAETLSLCRHCKCLFWRSLGHPCIADQCPEYRERLNQAGGPLPPHPIPPADFLKFFSL